MVTVLVGKMLVRVKLGVTACARSYIGGCATPASTNPYGSQEQQNDQK